MGFMSNCPLTGHPGIMHMKSLARLHVTRQ